MKVWSPWWYFPIFKKTISPENRTRLRAPNISNISRPARDVENGTSPISSRASFWTRNTSVISGSRRLNRTASGSLTSPSTSSTKPMAPANVFASKVWTFNQNARFMDLGNLKQVVFEGSEVGRLAWAWKSSLHVSDRIFVQFFWQSWGSNPRPRDKCVEAVGK